MKGNTAKKMGFGELAEILYKAVSQSMGKDIKPINLIMALGLKEWCQGAGFNKESTELIEPDGFFGEKGTTEEDKSYFLLLAITIHNQH